MRVRMRWYVPLRERHVGGHQAAERLVRGRPLGGRQRLDVRVDDAVVEVVGEPVPRRRVVRQADATRHRGEAAARRPRQRPRPRGAGPRHRRGRRGVARPPVQALQVTVGGGRRHARTRSNHARSTGSTHRCPGGSGTVGIRLQI